MGGSTSVRRVGCIALLALVLSGVSAAGAQATPVVSVTGGSGAEGTGANTTATFTVTSTEAAPTGGLTVLFQTQNAGAGAAVATAGQDFLVPSGNSVEIPAGETSATVQVVVVADATDEADQLFALRVTDVTGGAGIDTDHQTGTWTIQDDDAAPTASIADGYEGTSASSPLPEGTGSVRQMTFEVTLSAPSEKTITVGYDTIPGTAKQQVTPGDDGDYQAPAAGHAPLTINAGSTSGKILISIIADSRDEADETFQVQLSTPVNTSFTRSTAVGKIIDDDGPTANILDATVTEGAGGSTTSADVTVVLDQASVQDVSFVFTTADDTAKAPDDYDAIATGQTLTIQAGRLTGTIRLTVHGDDLDEGDEQFKVKLTLNSTSNANLGDGTAAVTIKDDDPPPALTVGDTTVTEGTGGTTAASVTITLAQPAARKLKVGYATQDASATAGVDYQATNTTVDFNAGETSQTVTIPIAPDAVLEPDEAFVLRAFHTTTDGSGQTVPDTTAAVATGVVTILDDDLDAQNTPTLSVSTARVQEGDSGQRLATFTVRLDAKSPRTVTARFHTADGTAKAGADYVPADGVVRITPDSPTATITVAVLGDTKAETNEDFTVVLSDAVNARTTAGGGLGIIIDDDAGGGAITLGSSVGRPVTPAIRLSSLICSAGHACRGVPVRWNVQEHGTIRIVVSGLVTRTVTKTVKGTGKTKKKVRRTTTSRMRLFTRELTVKPGPGGARVSLAKGRTASRLLRRLRAAKVRQVEITVTFTNRRGGRQSPATFVLDLR